MTRSDLDGAPGLEQLLLDLLDQVEARPSMYVIPGRLREFESMLSGYAALAHHLGMIPGDRSFWHQYFEWEWSRRRVGMSTGWAEALLAFHDGDQPAALADFLASARAFVAHRAAT